MPQLNGKVLTKAVFLTIPTVHYLNSNENHPKLLLTFKIQMTDHEHRKLGITGNGDKNFMDVGSTPEKKA